MPPFLPGLASNIQTALSQQRTNVIGQTRRGDILAGAREINQARQQQVSRSRQNVNPSSSTRGNTTMSLRSQLESRFGPRRSGQVVSVRSNAPQLGGGVGGGTNPELQRMITALQKQRNEANRAAELRFQGITQQATQTRTRALGANTQAQQSIANLGASSRASINRRATQRRAASTQSLISRGLGNTTVVEGQQRAITSDADAAITRVNEGVGSAQAGIFGDRAGIEERTGRLGIDTALSRQDELPALSMTLQLLQQLAGGFN